MTANNLEMMLEQEKPFNKLNPSEKRKLFNLMEYVDTKESVQSVMIKAARDSIFIIVRGEVLINSVSFEDKAEVIKSLSGGDIWFGGELDSIKIKKIILNISPKTTILRLRLSDLYYQVGYRQIFFKVATALGLSHPEMAKEHLVQENNLMLFNQNELERRVLGTQYFVSGALLMFCAYITFLNMVSGHIVGQSGTVPVTLGFFTACLIAYPWQLRRAHLPGSAVGLSLVNTRVAVKEALIGVAPLLFIAIFFKWILIHTVPSLSHDPLFDIQGTINKFGSLDKYLSAAAAYMFLSVPLQELIMRGGVQGCLQMIFTGRKNMWQPILVANALFASVHMLISPFAAIIIFFPGLYWGWLFARHHNLIGVCVSHAIFGGSAFFLMGYLDILKI
jgi:hypothetical protein